MKTTTSHGWSCLKTLVRYWMTALAGALGLLLIWALWVGERAHETAQRGLIFDAMTQRHLVQIQSDFDKIHIHLGALKRLFDASETVTQAEFVIGVQALQQLPGVLSVAWLPRSTPTDGTGHWFIKYLYPEQGHAPKTGWDADTEKAFHTAAARAGEEGGIFVTPELSAPTAYRVLYFRPVYLKNQPGVVGGHLAVFMDISHLLAQAMAGHEDHLAWVLYDAQTPDKAVPLDASRGGLTTTPGQLQRRLPWNLPGQAWEIEMRATPAFFRKFDSGYTWLILGGGLAMTLGLMLALFMRQRYVDHIEAMAYYDPLTQLPNRLLFHDRLKQAIARAGRSKNRLAVLYLDVDRFKQVNDHLGHESGDRLLHGVAKRMKDSLREVDTVARLGGDEFVVLTEGLERDEDAGLLAKKLKDAVAAPFDIGQPAPFHVTLSIGIGLYPRDAQDMGALLRVADAAMYRTKQSGRNGYSFFAEASPAP